MYNSSIIDCITSHYSNVPPYLLLVTPPGAVRCHAYVDFYLERHDGDFLCRDDSARGQIALQRAVSLSLKSCSHSLHIFSLLRSFHLNFCLFFKFTVVDTGLKKYVY